MPQERDGLDWGLLRSFLAVAQTGSLSAAARQLGQTQPTVGRQIRSLEEEIGAELFVRHARGLGLSSAGERLLPAAEEMSVAARRLSLIAAGQQEAVSGTVRITASVVVSHYVLPPIIAGLRQAEPGIEVELVPDDSTENLLFREADIAIRMYKPTQLDLVTRKVGDGANALYASRAYVERHGTPSGPEDIASHQVVGFDRSELIIDLMRENGWEVNRHSFGVRCDNQAVYWELGRAGCGLVGTQTLVGDPDPTMLRVAPWLQLGSLPYWLAVPGALRHQPRVRTVFDALADGLSAALAAEACE